MNSIHIIFCANLKVSSTFLYFSTENTKKYAYKKNLHTKKICKTDTEFSIKIYKRLATKIIPLCKHKLNIDTGKKELFARACFIEVQK